MESAANILARQCKPLRTCAKRNHEVFLFDTNLRMHQAKFVKVKEHQPKYFIYDDGFNYLTKMCLTNMREAACEMAEESKKHGCVVIINSSGSTDQYEYYLKRGVDFVVREKVKRH